MAELDFLREEVVNYGFFLMRYIDRINLRKGKNLSLKTLLGFSLEEKIKEIEEEKKEEVVENRLETVLDMLYTQISNLESEYGNIYDEVVNEAGDNPAIERFDLFDKAGLEPDPRLMFEWVDFLNDDEVDEKIRKPHNLQKYQAEDYYIGGNSEESE